jgi:membrane protein
LWKTGLSWQAFARRLYREYRDDAVADSAATLSYYFVFSLFPFLFFLATLTAYIPYARVAADALLARAYAVLPGPAMAIIDAHVRGLVGHSRPHLLTLGFAITLYSASRGVDAVRKALNRAYDVKESRPLWKTELLAFGMTVGGAALVLVAVGLLLAGSSGGLWLAHRLRIDEQYVIALRWIRWPVIAVVIMGCAAIAYHLLPDVERRFKLITPGSVLGTLVWFGAVLGFGVYAAHFGSYNVTYGSIGGVILLLTWFYITGFIFLMGGEVNAILEAAAADVVVATATPSPTATPTRSGKRDELHRHP